jgi:alcohol dehydrogenase class IV
MNIAVLTETDPQSPTLRKYAHASHLLTGTTAKDPSDGCTLLVETLYKWINELRIPRLSAYGVTGGDLDRIISETGNKNNPVELNTAQIRAILMKRL